MTRVACQIHNRSMQLSSTLSWLVDAAGDTSGADRLLAELGAHLVEDGLPLSGGALSLAAILFFALSSVRSKRASSKGFSR